MKILMINVACGIGSTGRICTDLAEALESRGHQVKIAYGRKVVLEEHQKYAIKIGTELDVMLHGVKARLLDGMGLGSTNATKKFIEWVKEYDPDVIHLHNIHGYYINVKVLFDYLRTCGKKIIWTLHDCWSFTGHCPHFEYVECGKWKKGCDKCQQKTEYPARIGPDFSKRNYDLKKRLFTNIDNMVLVTPSNWLKELVGESFLKEYETVVINNGIDTKVFKPVSSDIKKRLGCENKKVVLGVASIWSKRKGLTYLIELSKKLSSEYQVVIVGLKPNQLAELPEGMIGIERTNSVKELAELYSCAEVYVNTTLEDNYPTTNLEAIACGTPVITFETGGSPESAKMYGKVVPRGDVDAVAKAVLEVKNLKKNDFYIDYTYMLEKYLKLYGEV